MTDVYKVVLDGLYVLNGCKNLILSKTTWKEFFKEQGYNPDQKNSVNDDLLVVNSAMKEINWGFELRKEDKDLLDECHISREWMLKGEIGELDTEWLDYDKLEQ